MSIFGPPTASDMLAEAEALERAAGMAREDGDIEHEKRLRQAALFKRRYARERAAGFKGWPTMAFDKI